ncbi:hypothetical protein [Pelagibius sp. Alg239-R121]|uniref:hypothetical protein n=1 Tax=Pelagibius sp. Alg239-R121 TaxID=2993448 RepID=UPI0024A6B08F|nr:hypothetical protein [Pelagibius sp. Alg239-R121]
MKQIKLQQVAKIPPSPKGFEFVSVSVSLKGEALFLYRDKKSSAFIGRRGESPSPRPSVSAGGHIEFNYKLIVTDGEVSEEIALPPLDFAFPQVDLLSDGSLVIVNAWAQWKSKEEHHLNGLIHSRTSGQQSRFYAGDAINEIGVDGTDRIWVSHFDEGVRGIVITQSKDGTFDFKEEPGLIGREGLNCFDSNGTLIWQHDQSERYIGDCYALNVADAAAHFVFEPDFDLGTVSNNFASSYRKVGLNACNCFAISSDRALFVRGRRRSVRAVYLMNLEAAATPGLRKCQLVLPNGKPLKSGRAVGRGQSLHLFTKKEWYRVRVEDI